MSQDLYKMACGMLLPKPDPKKGKTKQEWAEEWGIKQGQRKVALFMKAGLMTEDSDWRPHGESMKRCAVYRWNESAVKKGASK